MKTNMAKPLKCPLEDEPGRPNADATLASLAFINVTWEAKRASYLDNFVPYALEALRVKGALEVAQVAEFIGERFGLDFPTNVVKSLLERGMKSQQIARPRSGREFQLLAGVEEKLPDLVALQHKHRREQVHLVKGLARYAVTTFELEWSDERAEEALVAYIDHQAVPLLASTQHGTEVAMPGAMTQGAGYVVARYVASIVESDPVAFGYLDGMIKGSMLASVLYVDTTGQTTRKFRKTVLYLDTPICLRALGHEGVDAEKAANQMLRLALKQGAEVACFAHNLREMRGVLAGAREVLRQRSGSESAVRGVATHFRETQATPADIDLAIARLEQDLFELSIQVKSSPIHAPAFGLDEASLEEVLQKRVKYFNPAARVVDVDSLSAIHRLRQGSSGPHLETCRAVLVTNNSSLVRASRDFFDSGRHEWPLAIVDHTLSALLWVKDPGTAPDLPRLQVLADCYSALSPSASLWSKIGDEIKRLESRGTISSDSITLLRYSHEAEQALMDVTLGDPNRVTEGAIHEALERTRAVVAQPAEDAAEQARKKAEELERAEAQSRFDAAVSTAENENLRKRVDSLEERASLRHEAIHAKAQRQALRFVMAVKVASWILLILGAVAGLVTLVPPLTNMLPDWLNTTTRIVAVVLGALGSVVLLTGGSVFALAERWRARVVASRLRKEGISS